MGVCAAHFVAGLVGCEHPFDASAGGVALSYPCGDFLSEVIRVIDPAVETLAAQDTDLDFDHVEPTGVLRGVVEFQAAQNAPGIGGREGLVEGAGRMGRQVVLHDADARCLGIVNVHEFAQALGIVLGCAPGGDLDLAPWPVHVEADEEIDGAVAAVLVVEAFELSGASGLAL